MRYFEDFKPGDVITSNARKIGKEEIIRFAREFDPQSFHIDEEAAKKSAFGGLVASGWNTSAVCMRLIYDSYLYDAASLGSPGIESLRWLKPVKPDDELTLKSHVLEVTPSRSKPDRGTVKMRWELCNQKGDVVMQLQGINMFGRRPA